MRLAALGAVVVAVACSGCTLVLEAFAPPTQDGDADIDHDTDGDADTDHDADDAGDTDPDVDVDPDIDVDPDREADPDTEADVEPDVDPESDHELDADPEPDGDEVDGDGAGDCDVAGHMGTSYNGEPCTEVFETWRCAWDTELESWCSQVCRAVGWQNFNCYMAQTKCAGCCDDYTSACVR